MIGRSGSRPTWTHTSQGEARARSQASTPSSVQSRSGQHSQDSLSEHDTDASSGHESSDTDTPATSAASSRRNSFDAKSSLQKEAAGFQQDHYMGAREAALHEITDNQRANHVAVTGASIHGPGGQLDLSTSVVGNADAVTSTFNRDRWLATIGNGQGDSGSAGVVAGCLFGSYSHTDASGLSVSAFGGTNGPVSFLGATVSEKVGAAVVGASVMPMVTATSGAKVLSVENDQARVAFKSARDLGLFVSGSAAVGASGLGVRVGATARQEVQVIRSVSRQEAKQAQSRSLLHRTVDALRHKTPLAVPSLAQPLGDPGNPRVVGFEVGDEVQTALRGTVIGGLSIVVGGAHFGANAAISGEMGLAVMRMPDNERGEPILRVGLTPTRTQAANLAVDLPLLGVMDASLMRGELMRSVWEFNLATPAGVAAYQDMLSGRLPQAPLRIDAKDLQSAETSMQIVQDAALPDGVSLLMVEANRLDKRISVGAAITAPGYVGMGKFGKIEWSRDRSDATSTLATQDAGLERRERQAGWTYELLRASGAHRSVHVLEERLLRQANGAPSNDNNIQEQERFLLSVDMRYPKQTPKAKEKIAQFLNEHVLTGERVAQTRFFGKESRDALRVTIGRSLDPDDIVRLIELGTMSGAAQLQARLEQASDDATARYAVIRDARQALAKDILKEGAKGLGRIHRALEGGDEPLTFSLENTTGERIQRKANKYAVQFFESLGGYKGLRLQEVAKRRLDKVGALARDIEKEREALLHDSLIARLVPQAEREARLEALEAAAAKSREVLQLSDVSGPQTRRLLSVLPTDDKEALQRLQTPTQDISSDEPATAVAEGGIASAVKTS